jgi:beta-lactamase class A
MYEVKDYTRRERIKSSRPSTFAKRFLFTLIILFIVNFLINMFLYKSPADKAILISPLAEDITHNAEIFINSRENSKNLEKIVKTILKDDSNYGVVIRNLKTGERYYFNESKTFETASLYKLWIMAEAFSQIQEGKLKETQILSRDVKELNEDFNIASESAELTEGTITWPVQNAIEQMIIISDNYSALLLSKKLGISTVAEFLNDNGLLLSKMGTGNTSPVSSASDIALFLEKLYHGELADKEYTDKMLSLLKSQRLNEKLPKNLPKDTVVAHKTGELGGLSHDAGIVYSPKDDYIIVIMSETTRPVIANEKIADISKEIYDYFSKN